MANESINNYKDLNDELFIKYEKLETQEKSKNEVANLREKDDLFEHQQLVERLRLQIAKQQEVDLEKDKQIQKVT